jgi:acid phosphatase
MMLLSLAVASVFTLIAASASPTAESDGTSSSSGSAVLPGNYFDRVVIFIFENENYKAVHNDAYFGSLASKHNGKKINLKTFSIQ